MRGHLTDEEMADGAGGALGGEAQAHLAECAVCRAELRQLHAAVAALAADVGRRATRPEALWERQRGRIAARVGRRHAPRSAWRWAGVPAAAALAALALSWVWWGRGTSPTQWTETDTVLLLAVQHAIDADAPSALWPVTLLVGEMEQATADTLHGRDAQKGNDS